MIEAWIIGKVTKYTINPCQQDDGYTAVWYEINGALFRAGGSDDKIKTIVTQDLYRYHGLGYYCSNHNVNEIVLVCNKPEVHSVTSFINEQNARELVELLQDG